MMPKNSPPSPAQSLVCIHRAITRGLTVGIAKATEFRQSGFPDLGTKQGFTDYIQSLATVLEAHHLGEDEVAFPAVRRGIPNAPYDRLTGDHQKIAVLVREVRQASANTSGESEQASLARLVDKLQQIAAIWPPHIKVEEEHFSAGALAAAMDAAEQDRLVEALAKHSQEHATPGPLTLPFTLFNLGAEDRAIMAATMPSIVTERLIPVVWQEQWASMRPFLLQ